MIKATAIYLISYTLIHSVWSIFWSIRAREWIYECGGVYTASVCVISAPVASFQSRISFFSSGLIWKQQFVYCIINGLAYTHAHRCIGIFSFHALPLVFRVHLMFFSYLNFHMCVRVCNLKGNFMTYIALIQMKTEIFGKRFRLIRKYLDLSGKKMDEENSEEQIRFSNYNVRIEYANR